MEKENVSKVRTCLVVSIFIVIIILSAYIVVEKITSNSSNSSDKEKNTLKTLEILKDSRIVNELSLDNEIVKKLYNHVNDEYIDYLAYGSREKQLSWDFISLIVLENIDSKLILKDEYNREYVEKELFEDTYKSIFGNNINNILVSDRRSTTCGSASYENDRYYVNWYCNGQGEYIILKTFLKNVTVEEELVKINKYYVFIKNSNLNGIEFDLYSDENLIEDNLIALDVKTSDISNYIDSMNTISYVYKKDNKGDYYLDKIE